MTKLHNMIITQSNRMGKNFRQIIAHVAVFFVLKEIIGALIPLLGMWVVLVVISIVFHPEWHEMFLFSTF